MTEEALKEIINTVKEKHHNKIEKIVLFGSYARGRDKLIDISFPLLLKHGVYISPHVMNTT